MTQTKTLSLVVDGKNGDYILTINVFSLTEPSFGLASVPTPLNAPMAASAPASGTIRYDSRNPPFGS